MREPDTSAFRKWKGVTVTPEQVSAGGAAMTREEQRECLSRVKKFNVPKQTRWVIQRSN